MHLDQTITFLIGCSLPILELKRCWWLLLEHLKHRGDSSGVSVSWKNVDPPHRYVAVSGPSSQTLLVDRLLTFNNVYLESVFRKETSTGVNFPHSSDSVFQCCILVFLHLIGRQNVCVCLALHLVAPRCFMGFQSGCLLSTLRVNRFNEHIFQTRPRTTVRRNQSEHQEAAFMLTFFFFLHLIDLPKKTSSGNDVGRVPPSSMCVGTDSRVNLQLMGSFSSLKSDKRPRFLY